MAKNLKEINKLEDEVKELKRHLDLYYEYFMEDGRIDDDEQAQLDSMNAVIENVQEELKRRIDKLSWVGKGLHKLGNLFEGEPEISEENPFDDYIETEDIPSNSTEENTEEEEVVVENETTTETSTETTEETEENTTEEASTPITEAPVQQDIKDSVGYKGINNVEDVRIVQELLNIKVDGDAGPNTIAAIKAFQKSIPLKNPDGRVDAGGKTWKELKASKVTVVKDNTNDNTDDKTNDEAPDKTLAPIDEALSVTSKITASVGYKGKNKPEEVVLVKKLLNKFGFNLEETPEADSELIEAIKQFQRDYRGSTRPDGRIDAGKGTWNSLLGIARIKGDILRVAKEYAVEPAVILAIQAIESGGNGFFSDGRPKILFEGHIFWRELKKIGKDPAALRPGNENILYPKWVKTHYAGGVGEYDRLEKAIKIDRIAALKSASWGEFQIMGFNHNYAGYSDVETFVDAMYQAGANQLSGLMGFLKGNNLLKHVQGDKKDWAALARGYNGPAYAENKYDIQLAKAYARFSKITL